MKSINYEINRDDVYVGVVSKIEQGKIAYYEDGYIEFDTDYNTLDSYRMTYSNQLYLLEKTPHLLYNGGWNFENITSRSSLFILDKNGCANDLLYDSRHYPIFNISPDELCYAAPICITNAYNMGLLLAYFKYPQYLKYKDITRIRDTFFGDFVMDNCELLGRVETDPKETGLEMHDRFGNHRTFNTLKEDSVFPDTYFEMLKRTRLHGFFPKEEIEGHMVRSLELNR